MNFLVTKSYIKKNPQFELWVQPKLFNSGTLEYSRYPKGKGSISYRLLFCQVVEVIPKMSFKYNEYPEVQIENLYQYGKQYTSTVI